MKTAVRLVASVLLCGGATVWAQAPAVPNTGVAVTPQIAIENSQRLINTGRAAQALQQLDSIHSGTTPVAGLDRARGNALYALNKLPEADQAFARALQVDANDRESAQMRGMTLYRMGRPAAAIPLLESSHAEGVQTKADPSYVLALCYMDVRRYDDARHAFAAQYGMQPDSAAAYVLAARMLLRREHLPAALSFATKGVELDPKLPLAHGLLGEIALAQNRNDDAIKEFEQERTLNPLEGKIYERLGDAYSRAAKYPEALRVLQQAVLLEPNATGPYILLGKVSIKQGDAAAASRYLQRAEAMDSSNYITHNLLAQAYRALGQTEDAAKELVLTEKIQSQQAPQFNTLK